MTSLTQIIKALVLSSLILSFMVCMFNGFEVHARQSDKFKVAADNLCNKMTQCLLDDIAENEAEYPPQMAQMVKQMAQNMCASFYEFDVLLDEQNIDEYDSGIKCLQSMEQQSCDVINEGFVTPECKAFESKLSQYSDDKK